MRRISLPLTLGAALALTVSITPGRFARAQQAPAAAALAARASALPPLAPSAAPQMAGARRVTATLCTLDGAPLLVENSFSRAVVDVAMTSTDHAVYLIDSNNAVRRYRAAPGAACALTLDPAFGTGGVSSEFGTPGMSGQLDHLTADARGHVYVSSMMRGTWRITGTHTDWHCAETRGRLTVSDDGRTGFAVSFNRAQRVTFTDTGCTVAPWTYQEPFTHTEVLNLVGNTVYVGGYNDNITRIVTRPYGLNGAPTGPAFGREGTWTPQAACYPHELFNGSAGLAMQEGNCRNFFFLSPRQEVTGRVGQAALFGLRYPWVTGVTAQPRQPAYVAVSQEIGQQSHIYQGLVYRVTGL